MKRFLVFLLVISFCFSGMAQYNNSNPYQAYKGFNPSAMSEQAQTPMSVSYPQSVYKPKIFGLGGTVPVIDYKAIYEAVKTYNKLKEQYRKVKAKYELALKMARFIQNMPERYRVMFAKFRKIENPDDFFNQVDSFMRAYNGEIQDTEDLMNKIDDVYKKTTKKIDKDDFSYVVDGGLISEEQADVFKDFAKQINIADNTNKIALSAITQANSIQQALEQKIENLDNDSLSSSEQLNSEIAVLNKINASLVILVKQQKQINNLLVAMLQQELTNNVAKRDAVVQGQIWENQKIKDANQEIEKYNRFFSLKLNQ